MATNLLQTQRANTAKLPGSAGGSRSRTPKSVTTADPTPWWCHLCGCRNRSSVENCRTCGRHSTWVPASQSASALRPLHTGTAIGLRFEQFEAILDIELGKDRTKNRLLEHAGFNDIQVSNPSADNPPDAETRLLADALLVAAEVAGRPSSQRQGTSLIKAANLVNEKSALDDADVVDALTGCSGETSYQRRTRRVADAQAAAQASAVLAKARSRRFRQQATGGSGGGSGVGVGEGNGNAMLGSPKKMLDLTSVVRTSALANGLARVHRLKHGAPVATDLAQRRVENAINDADDHGWMPLHIACRNGAVATVNSLLAAGAIIQAKTRHGWRPLHLAAAGAHVSCVRVLLQQPGCLHNWTTEAELNTPLHSAAASDGPPHLTSKSERDEAVCNVMRLLVYYGASPAAQNFMGRAPLHLATEQGSARVCRCLLQLGADLNATDHDGWSARQLAEFLGHAEVGKVFVEALCERGNGVGAVVPTSLPPPNYRNSMFKGATEELAKGKARALHADYKRETYGQSDDTMRAFVQDLHFTKHLTKYGPGQTPLDYDRWADINQGVPIAGTYASDARAPARAALTAEEQEKKKYATQQDAVILHRPKATIKQPYRPGSSSSDPAATLKKLSVTRAASRDERRRTFGATLDAIKPPRTPQLY